MRMSDCQELGHSEDRYSIYGDVGQLSSQVMRGQVSSFAYAEVRSEDCRR